MIKQLYSMYDSGNFNLCLQTALKNFNSRTRNKSAVMDMVLKIISDYNQFLTSDSVKTIYDFRRFYVENNTLTKFFDKAVKEIIGKNFSVKNPAKRTGETCFPAVASTQAAIYTIKTVDARSSKSILKRLCPYQTQIIDITGSALFSWLNSKNSLEQNTLNLSVPTTPAIPIFWEPSCYSFIIEDSFNKEVNSKVEGDSMGIAVLISLFSLLFNEPVPVDTASTGIVKRDGSILPVHSIKEKLVAIKRERDYITRIVISNKQEFPENPPQFQYIRVNHIQDVIENIFPNFLNSVQPCCLASFIFFASNTKSNSTPNITIDLKNVIHNIKIQYQDYLIDTCMDNCRVLINYIQSAINGEESESKKRRGTDKRIEHLFQCYWKLGACCCHKGNIGESRKYFEMAQTLYNQNRSIIEPKDYYNFQNNYAVLLKDIFCYQEAEKLHLKIDHELTVKEFPKQYISENLSSLSQLYLAQHRYKEAKELQLKALEFIDIEEQHRNLGYLAQIYARAGDFCKAEESLKEAKEFIQQIVSKNVRSRQLDFYNWIESEYLYRFCTSSSNFNQKLTGCYDRFCNLYEQYENITHFSHGLINKFCSLGILFFGEHQRGLELLRKSENFFDNQLDPMMQLLGVTVRIEKIAAWLNTFDSIFPTPLPYKERINNMAPFSAERLDVPEPINLDIKQEVQKVIQGLSSQQNIRAFFQTDIKQLERYIADEPDSISHTLNYEVDNNFHRLFKTLKTINKKIPY